MCVCVIINHVRTNGQIDGFLFYKLRKCISIHIGPLLFYGKYEKSEIEIMKQYFYQ